MVKLFHKLELISKFTIQKFWADQKIYNDILVYNVQQHF